MRILFLPTVLLTVFLALPALAGTLFPPENIGANPNIPCPNGTVLSWSGNSVVCQNPSPGVTVTSCPSGQVMIGITNGAPVCTTPTTTTTASCPSGQVMTGLSSGSPVCSTVSSSTTFTCPTGQAVSGFSSGTPVCSTPTGAISYTSCAWKETRWTMTSLWSGFSRTHSNERNIECNNGEVLVGFSQIMMSTGGIAKILCCK